MKKYIIINDYNNEEEEDKNNENTFCISRIKLFIYLAIIILFFLMIKKHNKLRIHPVKTIK
jgi:hypothetical protein